MLTHQGGPFVQSSAPEGVINLALGQPSPRLLPIKALGEAASMQLESGDSLVLQYGSAQGELGFRRALAGLLSAELGAPVDASELMVSAGISSALALVGEVFAAPGATLVCGDPTYFLAPGVFESLGLRVHGIPVDAEGLRVDLLERALEGGLRPALVYCVPVFHNPTGVCLSSARARQLLELAGRYDFLVIADEPYALLHFDRRPRASLVAMDGGRGRVLSLGSFSKILAPGLRLGWIQGLPVLVERVLGHGSLRSGGGLNPVVAHIVRKTIESGFVATQVESLRQLYESRARALCDALERHAPGLRFTRPRGGYFVWVDLGEGGDAEELLARASDLRFLPGSRCTRGTSGARFLRLSISFYESAELREGARRLGALLSAQRP